MDCGPILVNVTGLAVAEIKSPKNNINYTGNLTCRRTLWTDDPGFYIKLLFTEFSMSGNCADNYIFLENATFSGTESPPHCCKKVKDVSCAFGSESGRPPLSHTDKNFMIVNQYVSNDSKSSSFSAKWYNVNGDFPYGLIPKDDLDYPDKVIIGRSKGTNDEDNATDPTYIAATVIFSIIAFAVLAIMSCKIGRHFLGPRCSVGYCCEWIATRRRLQSPRLSPRREPSPETRPIRGDIQNERTQGRTQRNVPVDATGTSSLRTRYGSAGEGVA